jgi:antitoxin YefM
VKRLDILEQPENVRALIGECELTGRRTVVERQGRPVAVLISYDEYMALRETIDISNDADLREAIARADAEVQRGAVLLTEDLFEKRLGNDRLRVAEEAERDWLALADHERDAVRATLERLDEDPIVGAPLFEPLRGLWSHRSGHLRVIYRIMPEARFIVILSIARTPEME